MARKKSEETHTKAWRAVTRFRAMTPSLSAFARSLTGNPRTSVIAVSNGAYSDGDKIYIGAPISLGEVHHHDRMVCNQRDEILQHLCPGCAQQEDIMYRLFHEMGHIVEKSSLRFEWNPVGMSLREYAQSVWREDFPWFSDAMPGIITKAKAEHNIKCTNSIELAFAISSWLKLFTNAVEDIRVDMKTWEVRPGIESMANAQKHKVMAEGIQYYNEDEVLVTESWSERSTDMQLVIGFLHKAFGFENLLEYLSEEAREVLCDAELMDYMALGREQDDCNGSFKLACRILHRMHQLGYCDPPPEPDPNDESEDDKSDESKDGESGEDPDDKGEPDKGDGDSDSTPGNGKPSDDKGNDGPTPKPVPCTPEELERLQELMNDGQQPTDPRKSDEEAIQVALVQAQWFEGPSKDIGGVVFHPYANKDDKHKDHMYDQGWSGDEDPATLVPDRRSLGQAVLKGRIVFSENKRSKMVRNKTSGRVAGGKLARAALDDERLFQKRERPGKRDYKGIIMLDISGSNHGGTIYPLRQMAMAQGELLSRLGVPFEMYAHTALPPKGDTGGVEYNLNLYPVVGVGERWNDESRERVAHLQAACCNLDGHAMEFARKQLDKSRATDKFILYSSDGAMPAENYHEEKEILIREIALCKKKGYATLGVGLGTDSPKEYGLDTVIVNSSSDIGLVIAQLEKHLL